jgi:putative ABC transport system permease protein
MIRNYVKIALRNILRNKVYSLINILGLSSGVACCLLLSLYVREELSYDRHHTRLSDLYRIDSDLNEYGKLASVSPPIAMTLREEIAEVESAVRIVPPPGVVQSLIKRGDDVFYESDGYLADSTLFDVFTYEFKEGSEKDALTQPNTVVISDKLARKLFGDESALDKYIIIDQGGMEANYRITGVFIDNKNSFLRASFFTSMMSQGWGEYLRTDPSASNEWAGQNFVPSYVRLASGHQKEVVEKKINALLVKYGAEQMKAMGFHKTLFLEPVSDIYLKSMVDRTPRSVYLYLIVSIAVFILLIGCINFMNLSTAKAMKRSTEIGVRKVMGAGRSLLIRQILGETLIIVLISNLLSIVIASLAKPYFNEISGKDISLDAESLIYVILSFTGLTLFTALIAGSYPAFYLSSFNPADVLKGKLKGKSSERLRRSLVVFQFIIAIALVSCVVVVTKQFSLIRETDLGFNKSGKVILPLRSQHAQSQYEVLKKQLLNVTGIDAVSGTEFRPGLHVLNDMKFSLEGRSVANGVDIAQNRVDRDYIELLGIKMIAGRSFVATDNSQNGNRVIVNRVTATELGVDPDKIVGETLQSEWQGQKITYQVIGVMDNFNQTSLKDRISPTLFLLSPNPSQYRFLLASFDVARQEQTIPAIRKIWDDMVPGIPFEFSFLSDVINMQYQQDERLFSIIKSFTAVAIVISCLGLYGLSVFMAETRFKEIGVRKVLGATVSQVAAMMAKEFIKLILLALIISVPFTWYAMHKWLEEFAFKIDIDITTFAYSGAVAVFIALFTVGYQTIRAASVNPIKSIRSE